LPLGQMSLAFRTKPTRQLRTDLYWLDKW